jgi:hypothetical protein
MRVDHLTCPACGQRIREREPDVILKRLDGSDLYFYHVRCAHVPEELVARDKEGWSMRFRRVWEEDGAA